MTVVVRGLPLFFLSFCTYTAAASCFAHIYELCSRSACLRTHWPGTLYYICLPSYTLYMNYVVDLLHSCTLSMNSVVDLLTFVHIVHEPVVDLLIFLCIVHVLGSISACLLATCLNSVVDLHTFLHVFHEICSRSAYLLCSSSRGDTTSAIAVIVLLCFSLCKEGDVFSLKQQCTRNGLLLQ